MADKKGWVLVFRSLQNKGYYKDSSYVHLWVHLLFKATHEEREFLWNNKVEKLRRGQMLTGRLELARETGIDEHKIDRILKCFKNEQQIEQQTTSKFRLITIKNYDRYQIVEQVIEQQMSNKRATSEQQVSTYKEHNELKEDKEIVKGKFQIPTLEEIKKYIQEQGYPVDPIKWHSHYESNGWVIGKARAPMKNWQAAVRTWLPDGWKKKEKTEGVRYT